MACSAAVHPDFQGHRLGTAQFRPIASRTAPRLWSRVWLPESTASTSLVSRGSHRAAPCWRSDRPRRVFLGSPPLGPVRSVEAASRLGRCRRHPPGSWSSSQGRLPSPSSHRTGLVDLTSGSSGHWGRQSAADRNRTLPPGTTAAEHRVGSLRTGAGLGLCSATPHHDPGCSSAGIAAPAIPQPNSS